MKPVFLPNYFERDEVGFYVKTIEPGPAMRSFKICSQLGGTSFHDNRDALRGGLVLRPTHSQAHRPRSRRLVLGSRGSGWRLRRIIPRTVSHSTGKKTYNFLIFFR